MAAQTIFTRDFIFCFLAQFAFTFVSHLLIPTLPIYLSRWGSSEVEIGILIGILAGSSVVLRPFVGRSLLKIPEKRVMAAGALISALTSISYIWISPFWPFLLVRILQGVGMALFYTAALTLIANISPEANRGQTLSYFFLSFNISLALSPPFGMFLINNFSFPVLFLCCVGLSLGSILLTTRLGERPRGLIDHRSKGEQSFISWEAFPSALISFFSHIIWGALTTFFPLYALMQGNSNPGFFFAVFAVVLILGRAFGGKIVDRYRREKVILPCLATYIIAMVVLAFSKTSEMFFVVAVIWGMGNAFLVPSLVAYVLERVGPNRGPALATFTALGDLGVALGPVLMGIVLRLTSYPIMFFCLALVGIINLNYFYFSVRKKETV